MAREGDNNTTSNKFIDVEDMLLRLVPRNEIREKLSIKYSVSRMSVDRWIKYVSDRAQKELAADDFVRRLRLTRSIEAAMREAWDEARKTGQGWSTVRQYQQLLAKMAGLIGPDSAVQVNVDARTSGIVVIPARADTSDQWLAESRAAGGIEAGGAQAHNLLGGVEWKAGDDGEFGPQLDKPIDVESK